MIKLRKIKHKWPKFFGFKDEKWARGGGPNGYKRNYGHFCSIPDGQTRVEHLDRILREELLDELKDREDYLG